MTIFVRSNVLEDWPVLRQLFLQSRRNTFTWQDDNTFKLTDLDEQTRGELLPVAEDGRAEIAGFVSVFEQESFIHHLHVVRHRHGVGVGKALLRALPGWNESSYRLKCLRLNQPALEFYRASGFVEIGSGTAHDGEYVLLEYRSDNAQSNWPDA
jgi:GNAT superfamily N-acetyltransferase